MLVHDFIPSTKEIWMSFAILQSIAVFMVIFNHFMNTDFMFVFIDQDKIEKFPAISKFGGIPFYLIWVEITGLSYFFIVDRMIRFIEQKQVVKEIKNA